MNGTQQPEALRLARKFEEVGFMGDHRFAKDHWCRQAAAELRHQHARIAELEAQLSATHPTQQGLDAQTLKHISALSELVRMPNAEHFADAHNAAVRHLRVIAAQAKQGG